MVSSTASSMVWNFHNLIAYHKFLFGGKTTWRASLHSMWVTLHSIGYLGILHRSWTHRTTISVAYPGFCLASLNVNISIEVNLTHLLASSKMLKRMLSVNRP